MRNFENVTAGTGLDPADIYADLGAEEQGVDPRTQPIHCFGTTTNAAIAAAAAGQITMQPSGMIIRPDSIEFSDAQAAQLNVTSMQVGGLPIMHGGTVPGDMFKTNSTYKLRPALAASSNNPLIIGLTNIFTAAVTPVAGAKGPVIRS
jgi:hypothetical protein